MSFFATKYLPNNFSDLIFNDDETRERVEDFIRGDRYDNILLHGPKGTAKSATARIIATSQFAAAGVNAKCQVVHASVLDEKAISNLYIRFNYILQNGAKNPYVVIEEVDQLKKPLQEALRRDLDEITCGKFILTTNNKHHLDVPLIDRCHDIEMPSIDPGRWFQVARDILNAENTPTTDAQLQTLLQSTNGSIRDLLSALEDRVLKQRRLARTVYSKGVSNNV